MNVYKEDSFLCARQKLVIRLFTGKEKLRINERVKYLVEAVKGVL